jgi:hypothetical protein
MLSENRLCTDLPVYGTGGLGVVTFPLRDGDAREMLAVEGDIVCVLEAKLIA